MSAIPSVVTKRSGTLPILALILLAQAGLVLLYSRLTPVGEGPDELSHLAYSRHLLDTGRLPVAGDRDVSLTQAEHPPLYYAAGAILGVGGDLDRLNPPNNPFFSANLLNPRPVPNIHLHPAAGAAAPPGSDTARRLRLLSLLCALLVTTATWRVVDQLLPGQTALALAAAALIAFWPAFAFAGAVFSNDMGANAASSWVLAGAARLLGPSGRGRRTLSLAGGALGLALLSKLTTLAMVPILGAAWLLERRRGRVEAGPARDLAALGLPLLLVFGWWPLRNMALYGWDQPLAWKAFAELARPMLRDVPLGRELPIYFRVQFETLLGRFGWVSVPQPPELYRAVGLGLALILVVGALALLWRGRGRAVSDPLTEGGLRALVLLAAAFAPVYLAVLLLGTRLNLVAAHARYAFSGLPLLAALLALCWASCWPPRLRAAALAALPAAVLGWSLWAAVAVLGPAYRMPAGVAPESTVAARFAPGIALRRAAVARSSASAGERLPVVLRLATLEDLSGRPATEAPGIVLFVQLIGAADRKAGQAEGPPFEGRFPFEAWPTDRDFLVTMDLPIAGDAPEGPVDLLIGLYPDGDAGQRLEAVDGSGNRLSQDAFRLPAAVTIRKAAASPDANAGSTGFGAAMARPGAGPGAGLLGIPGWPR